ncbi:MAG: hypothetical protein J6R32_06400 [Bacteroidales bacterium]|nr:hypothetical protein [Bacteroidales bacterium]
MEYTKPKTTKLEEILLYFICRAGVYPFDKMGVAPYVAFLRKVREANIEGVSIPEDEEGVLELVDNLIMSLVDKGLVVIGDGEYLVPFRDFDATKISFKDAQKIALITNCLTNSDWAYYSGIAWAMTQENV